MLPVASTVLRASEQHCLGKAERSSACQRCTTAVMIAASWPARPRQQTQATPACENSTSPRHLQQQKAAVTNSHHQRLLLNTHTCMQQLEHSSRTMQSCGERQTQPPSCQPQSQTALQTQLELPTVATVAASDRGPFSSVVCCAQVGWRSAAMCKHRLSTIT